MKTCSKCKMEKKLDQFKARSDRPGHFKSQCNACDVATTKAWRQRNPSNVRKHNKDSYAKAAPSRRSYSSKYKKDNREAVNAANALRRAVKAGATIGVVNMSEVLSSSDDCYLCGDLLAAPVHVDHVVPLSRGGSYSMDNLRPTHEACNLRKGNRLASELDWAVV